MSELFAGHPHTALDSLRQSLPQPVGRGTWRWRTAAALLAGCGVALTASSAIAQQWNAVPPAAVPVPPAPVVAEVAAGPQAGRPLPEQISAMPAVSQNLDVVQHHSQLMVARSNIVRTAVADPAIVDVVQYSPNELSIIGLELGSTTLTLWFDNSHQPLIYQVSTIHDPSVEDRRRAYYNKLERKLAILFPNSKVFLIPFSEKLVVKGQAHDAEEAAKILQIIRGEVATTQPVAKQPPRKRFGNAPNEPLPANEPTPAPGGIDVVNLLEVPGEFQVMLRVRIAELNRSMLRSLGVNLDNVLFDPRHTVQQIRNTRRRSLAGIFENGEIDAAIHALISNSTATILSEPVLTVVSGHAASFLSGGEFAVPTVVGVEGVGAQQTTFHGFGTSLVVTPVVLDHGVIRMKISPEFSQLDSANTVNGIPGVDTRRAETTVQLKEGQTIVLAGLISRQTNTQVVKTPGWGEMPVVGPLFSGRRATQDETELLILVTPEIVRPMETEEVPPLPGHDVSPPSNCEFFKFGRTESVCPAISPATPYGQNPNAATGFQIYNTPPGMPTGAVPTTTPGAAPMMTPPGVVPAPPASAQLQSLQRPIPASGTGDASVNGQSTTYYVPSYAPVQQVSGSFVVPVSNNGAANANAAANAAASQLQWYQRPFRSFGSSEASPQRPNPSNAITPVDPPTVPGAMTAQRVQP
jgi:pilus assembly protein CpaC